MPPKILQPPSLQSVKRDFMLASLEISIKRMFEQSEERMMENLQARIEQTILENVNVLRGPQGDIGLTGGRGLQGEQGIAIKGERGEQGEIGKNIRGKTGPVGEQGFPGIEGETKIITEVPAEFQTLKELIEMLERKIDDIDAKVIKAKRVGVKAGKSGGGGGSLANSKTITSDTILNNQSRIIFANAEKKAITVTLPLASQAARKEFHIKKIDSSVNKVTIATHETIDGEKTVVIETQYTSCRLYSTGIAWFVI